MKIIGSGSSPFLRKTRIVALLKAIPHEFVLELQWAPESKVYLLNPLGKVPVLSVDDSLSVFDSRLIVEYLDALPSTAPSIYAAGNLRFACKQVEVLADGVIDAAALSVQETWRQEAARSKVWRERQLGKVARGLASLNKSLGEKPYFFENRITVADIATVCALDFVRGTLQSELDWNGLSELIALGQRLNETEVFITTKPFRAPGTKFPDL